MIIYSYVRGECSAFKAANKHSLPNSEFFKTNKHSLTWLFPFILEIVLEEYVSQFKKKKKNRQSTQSEFQSNRVVNLFILVNPLSDHNYIFSYWGIREIRAEEVREKPHCH